MKSNKGQSQDYVAGYRAGVQDSLAPGSGRAAVVAVLGLLLAGVVLGWVVIGLMGVG